MADSILGIRSTLDSIAKETWTKIADSRDLGVPIGEIGITDSNMLALRREHRSLIVHKHSVHEEVHTGADWEWWINTTKGWLCLVFQAKILDASGRYGGITKCDKTGRPQVEILLESCLRRSELVGGAVWPFYCLYNSWSGGWPIGVPAADGLYAHAIPPDELQLFGCAAADAWSVKRILRDDRFSNRRTLRDSYLPFSRPWSVIFPDPATEPNYDPAQTIKMLSSWTFGRGRQLSTELSAPPDSSGEDGQKSEEISRRDRTMAYRDPALIQQPPRYVRDLIDGVSRRRRVKPLGQRVVVLP